MQRHRNRDRRSREPVIAEKLRPAEFPRSASYDPEWALENLMGPNVLWLAESLSQALELEPGMRVLDLGCGKAVSSIFLAKEFGVQVWATDLWIAAGENWGRVCEAGTEKLVFPIHAEAHALPFAEGFFDALVSLDAYHYFGTDDHYLGGHFAPLVKPGGQIGIVVPGLVREFDGDLSRPERPQIVESSDICLKARKQPDSQRRELKGGDDQIPSLHRHRRHLHRLRRRRRD